MEWAKTPAAKKSNPKIQETRQIKVSQKNMTTSNSTSGGRRPPVEEYGKEVEEEEEEVEEEFLRPKDKGLRNKLPIQGKKARVDEEDDGDTGTKNGGVLYGKSSKKPSGELKRVGTGYVEKRRPAVEDKEEVETEEEEDEEEDEEEVVQKKSKGRKPNTAPPPPPPPPPSKTSSSSNLSIRSKALAQKAKEADSDSEDSPSVRSKAKVTNSKGARVVVAPPSPVDSDEEGEEEEGDEDNELIAWVKKRPPTKMGVWQSRLLKLSHGVIYFHETEEEARADEFSSNLSVTDIFECKLMCGPGQKAANDKEKRSIIINGDALSFENEGVRDEWLEAILVAKKAFGEGEQTAGYGGASDSDEDGNVGQRSRHQQPSRPLGLAPKWFKDYEGKGEKALVKWSTATSILTSSLFTPVAEAGALARRRGSAGGAGDGEGDEGTPNSSSARQATSATVDAMLKVSTEAAAILLERCAEAARRDRTDVVRHLVKAFDTSFYNSLSVLTSGNELGRLGAKALMQLLDSVQGYMGARESCLRGISLVRTHKKAASSLKLKCLCVHAHPYHTLTRQTRKIYCRMRVNPRPQRRYSPPWRILWTGTWRLQEKISQRTSPAPSTPFEAESASPLCWRLTLGASTLALLAPRTFLMPL